jgi:MFS family permease
MKLRPAGVLVAIAAGLALADSSVVALALPPIRVDLTTDVPGLAAVIGVYVAVLAAGLYPAAWVSRRLGAATTGAIGFVLLGLASVGCAEADSMTMLLVFRGLQALGGAAGVLAAFDLLDAGGQAGREERHLWIAAAVFGTAAGPAVGGILTEIWSWREIFWVQLPIGLIGAAGCLKTPIPLPTHHSTPFRWKPLVALALLAGGLTAVLFTLVLQLVAGWSVSPIKAAIVVSVLPISAIATSYWTKIEAGPRAALGCLMVGIGTLCLGFNFGASVLWTVPAQLVAGIGMGLALPALTGEVLPEKSTADAARLLTARHIGIVLALVVIAWLVNQNLAPSVESASKQSIAVLLDSKVAPTSKLTTLGALSGKADSESPRGEIHGVLYAKEQKLSGSDKAVFTKVVDRVDDSIVRAMNNAFRWAYLVAGLMSLIGAVLLADAATLGAETRRRLPAAAAGLALLGVYLITFFALRPAPVPLQDPCKPRDLPKASGLFGAFQSGILKGLDKAACADGATREELVLALDPGSTAAANYQAKYGHAPISLKTLTGGLIGSLPGSN